MPMGLINSVSIEYNHQFILYHNYHLIQIPMELIHPISITDTFTNNVSVDSVQNGQICIGNTLVTWPLSW